MPGEEDSEHVIKNLLDKFRTKIDFVVLDQIINSILVRFEVARHILKDLSLLSYSSQIRPL